MPSRIRWCSRCGHEEPLLGTMPDRCPSCQVPTRWLVAPAPERAAAVPDEGLSLNDRRFLKSIRIDPDA